ncbi:MAG: HEPN domain-containing protein [Bacteroidales bacterium]|nr:HEPN domain-containing protein [Bacteroidales bacterium]
MLTDEERLALVNNKVSRSRETWKETEGIIESGYWYAAANRMYYACYYMASALLLKDGYSARTHSGIIGLFGQHYVKTGIVPSELGKFYSQLFELRQSGDYDDWKVVTSADVLPLVPLANKFLDTIESIILKSNDV